MARNWNVYTDDGHIYFEDENDKIEITEAVDPDAITYDERTGYMLPDGRNITDLRMGMNQAEYKGVKISDAGKGRYPFTGNGIIYSFRTARDLFDYIDKALASGKQAVNERGSLMFVKASTDVEPYSKETFKEMIRDWQADNAPMYDDLMIGEPIFNELFHPGEWTAVAADEFNLYTITDDGTGNIVLNYDSKRQ